MNRLRKLSFAVSLSAATLGTIAASPGTFAQSQIYAYPLAKQSQQQQQKDGSECHEWSVGQTRFNPNTARVQNSPSYGSPPPSSGGGFFGRGNYGEGGGIADAGKGAAVGGIVGAIAGNTGTGLAIGALSGLFIGGVKRSNQDYEREQWERQQAQMQAQQRAQAEGQYAQGLADYNRAYAACMSARDYRVQ